MNARSMNRASLMYQSGSAVKAFVVANSIVKAFVVRTLIQIPCRNPDISGGRHQTSGEAHDPDDRKGGSRVRSVRLFHFKRVSRCGGMFSTNELSFSVQVTTTSSVSQAGLDSCLFHRTQP